ncbi:MAG: biopolymer transporter ExbD [Opitutae bacterium]|nr:biopolymer transporter ExbD [Opitutae bacterium]
MITRPLDLQSKLNPPPRDLDLFFWVNVGVVALFFALLGSRFVLAPGVPVQVGGTSTALELPQANSAVQGSASVVVSYRRDNMVLFEGGIYELRDLRKAMESYAKKHPGATMLVRVDKQVSVQGLLDLFDMARSAGFAQVLLAAEPHANEESALVTPTR